MNLKHLIMLALGLIILFIVSTIPLWWDAMAPYIFGFPTFTLKEINAYIDAVKWLWNVIFG